MILTIGGVALFFTLITASFSIASGIIGVVKKRKFFLDISKHCFYLHFYLTAIATVALIILLIQSDFSVQYVAQNTNKALPLFYKITSLWAGQSGSLLWWNFLLVLFSVLAVRGVEKKEVSLVPYMVIILMSISLFFCILNNFSWDSDPFAYLTQGNQNYYQKDGRGLNPLLQHWAMIIHPPILYFGYVSFAIPYSIAMAALCKNYISLNWTKIIRRWTVFSWFFLGFGILLGGKWAYEELGWGGYWAWDPVENASLMPWLTSTAFLHSIIAQENRDIFKVWNMVLVSLSFIMCIFGTFLTRSGIVSSVHSFASTDLGYFFLLFIAFFAMVSVVLIIVRLPILKNNNPINSYLSREASFLYNNVLLLILLIVLIWGTLYPSFTEFFYKERSNITSIWFNQWMTPIGLLLLFVSGSGPLLSWRKTSKKILLRNFARPTVAFLIVNFLYYCWLFFEYNAEGFAIKFVYVGFALSLAAFLIVGVLEEFYKVASVRAKYTGEFFLNALWKALLQNKRRYIGYISHIGLAVLFIGFCGKAFTKEATIEIGKQEVASLFGYTIKVADFQIQEYSSNQKDTLYLTEKAYIELYKNNKFLGKDTTERRLYPMYDMQTQDYTDSQSTSEPAIFASIANDIYIQYAGREEKSLIFKIWKNPVVSLVWFGFFLFVFSGIILLIPFGEKNVIRIGKRTISLKPQSKS